MFKASEARAKTKSEILTDLKNLKQEQINLRFQKSYDQLSSPARVRQVRRQIAALLTVLNEKSFKGAE